MEEPEQEGGVTLYDRTTGAPKAFNPNDAAAAVMAGTHGVIKTDRIPVKLADGRLGTVPGTDLAQTIAGGGGLASAEEWDQHEHAKKLKEKYGPTVGGVLASPIAEQVHAWDQGMFSGATAGLGPALMRKGLDLANPEYGKAYAESTEKAAEHFHKTNVAGNIAGAVAGSVVGGAAAEGAGLVGGAAKFLPSAMIDTVGGAAERGIGGLAARTFGEGALARAGTAGLGLAARGAAEGTIYGATEQIGEDVLGNHELNAEKILTSGAMGGLTGFLVGGTLGAGGSLLKSGATQLATEFAPKLTKLANEQAVDAMGRATPTLTKKMEDMPGGKAGMGQFLKEEGIIPSTVAEAASEGTPQKMLEKVQLSQQKVGAELGALRAESPATVNVGELLDRIGKPIDELRPSAIHGNDVKALESYRMTLAEKLGAVEQRIGENGKLETVINHNLEVPVQDVLAQRKFLDQRIYEQVRSPNPNEHIATLRKMRGAMEALNIESMDNAAKAAGKTDVGDQLRSLAKRYQYLSIAEDVAEHGVTSKLTNNVFGLTSVLGASAGAKLGATVGGLAAGPVGAMVGGVAGGAAGGALTKAAMDRGNAVSSVILDKLANIGAIQRITSQVDNQIHKSVHGLMGGAHAVEHGASLLHLGEHAVTHTATHTGMAVARKSTEAAVVTIASRYSKAADHVAQMSDQASMMDHAVSEGARVGEHAPATQAAVSANIMTKAAYLSSKLPVSPPPTLGMVGRPRVPDPEASSFLRTYKAVNDPQSVLKEWERGKVTREGVDALKNTSPEIYQELKEKTLSVIAERGAKGKPLPYETRLKLGILFDAETDPTLQPKTMKALQSNVADDIEKADSTRAGPAPSSPVKFPSQTDTLDRVEQR